MPWSSKKPDHAKRMESRRWHKEAFATKISVLRTKTGDESLLVLKSKDKEGVLRIFTTDPVDLYYENATSEDANRRNISIIDSTVHQCPVLQSLPEQAPPKGANLVQLSVVSTKSVKLISIYYIISFSKNFILAVMKCKFTVQLTEC